MMLLGKPYVSPLLSQTLSRLHVPTVRTDDVEIPYESRLVMKPDTEFFHTYRQRGGPILTSSENAQAILEKHLADHAVYRTISLFKNKTSFRQWIKDLYPSFFFQECTLGELWQKDLSDVPFPVIVKPAVGYASLGVYRLDSADDWESTCLQIERDMGVARKLYPQSVLDADRFILEEWIDGEEYAIDMYFSRQGKPVILNLFKRMFAHAGDTSDRIYYTGRQVFQEALDPICSFLQQIGKKEDFRFMPLHVEVRITASGLVVPVEVNPLRFAGIGTTDLGYYAFGLDIYEYFFHQKEPNWENILASADEAIYSFFCAELPVALNASRIAGILEQKLCSQFSQILIYRPMLQYDPTTFAVIFYRSEDLEENKRLLQLDLTEYIQLKELVQQ